MFFKIIKNKNFFIIFVGAILILKKNKKIHFYLFTYNPLRLIFSLIPLLSNVARIYPRYLEISNDHIVISFLNRSLIYFDNYTSPKILNSRFLSPAINYKKKEIIFGDYINYNNFFYKQKHNYISIRKFDGINLQTIKNFNNIKHIHNIEFINDNEIVLTTGDSTKDSKIIKMNINNLNLELLASQRCSWIVKLENENVFLAGTDYPSKENFIIKYLLTENKLKVIEKQPIPNSSIYFNKIYNNNSIDIYFSTSVENYKFFQFPRKVYLYKYSDKDSKLKLINYKFSFLSNFIFGFSTILIHKINDKITYRNLNCFDYVYYKEYFFNLLKVIRYFNLYGFRRTYIKVKSRFHMLNEETFEGNCYYNQKHSKKKQYVAIIGSGNFAFSNIAYFITKKHNYIIKYFYDIDNSKSLNASRFYKSKYATSDINQILNDKDIKMVFIATNHSSHEYYASMFLKRNVHVHIEKPHVTSFDQLNKLIENKKNNKIFLGFNRPKSYLFKIIQELLKKENGPISLNWFILGHQIDLSHWYFFKEEGGRILGNFTHWIDLTFQIIGKEAFPCKIKCTDSENNPSDFTFILQFANGSQASLMFSAKGEVFDGVRESLTLQKSNLFLKIDDFKNLFYQKGSKIYKKNLSYRDHGHETNILNSLDGVLNFKNLGETKEYIYNTAYFYLKIKESYETNSDVNISDEELI